MDDNGHGTHVAGTIGAVGNNGVGVVGVNWNVQIMPLKFLGADGSGTTSAAVEAVNYATMMRNRGVSIMLTNNSWGSGSPAQALYDAISASRDADMLFVAAAGNSNSSTLFYPAGFDLDNIISVAATDRNDAKASFSNFGDWVDLGAPGVDILSTLPGEGYDFNSGTSMAAPHVSGVAALAWSLDPQATYQTVRDAIFGGVDPIASMAGITVTGGRLNANNTLGRIGMVVSGSSPAAGEIVTTQPAEFVIDFSFSVNSDTLDASDLTVNGSAADSVTLVDADTVQFHFNSSPVTVQGLQTMRMAAGSVETTSPVPSSPGLHEWVATFRYDETRMQVVATDPPDASVVTLPFTTLTIHLNERVDPSTIGTDDLVLNQGRVVHAEAVDRDGDGNVDLDWVRYTLDEILSEGTLAVVVPAGALADEYGNPIVKYQGSFELDFGTVPLPVPLARQQPWGSLVYSGTVTGSIRDTADTDSFTLDLAAGEGITAVVDPDSGLQPTIKVFDPFENLLGSASASAAGGDAVVQMVPVETAGRYRLEVSGVGDSTGSYALQVVLNAAVESELHGQENNDTLSAAQDLDAAFLALGTGSRAAVLGQADGFDTSLAVTKSYSKSNLRQRIPSPGSTTSTITINDSYTIVDVNVRVDITHPDVHELRASLSAPGGDGRVLLFSGVGGNGDNFTGTTLDDEAETNIRDATAPFTGTFRPEGRLAAFDGMNVQGTWTLQVEDTVSQDSGKLNSWGIEVTTAPPLLDYFKFTLGASERATLALTALAGGTVSLELQDASGTRVATGTPGKANVHAVIDRTLSPGTYYAVVKGDSGAPYSLTVFRQAAFDLEPNNESSSAQDVRDVSGQATLVGALLSPDPVFVTPGSGGLMGPTDLAFGPDGDLYLADNGGEVLRFDGTTGGFIGVFASGGATARTPVFGPDGHLYVTNARGDSVTRYNGITGEYLGVFVSPGSGGLDFPWGLAFGPDSTGEGYPELYVASYRTDSILRYDGATGEFIDEFVPAGRGGLDGPRMIRFGPDANGDGIQELYVAAGDVLRYDGKTGAFVDVVVARGEGGLDGAVGLTFGPDGSLYVTGQGSFSKTMNHGIFVFRTPLRDYYRLELPGGTQVLNLSTTTPLGDLNRLDPKINLYDMNGSLVASDDNSATDGRNALLSYPIPPVGASAYYYVEILPSDDPLAQPTEGEYILQIEASTENPEPGILVNKTSLATEEGAENTFTVRLNTAPSFEVSVALTITPPEAADEATLSPTSLTFTSENWYLPRTVTVTGVRDFVDDGDVLYRIELAASSSDLNYDGKRAAISAINLDRDTAGITVSPTRGLITTEAGGTDTFTVVLDSKPSAEVTIALSSSDPTEGSVAPDTLTFTPENWNIPQTVTVTGIDDQDPDFDVEYTVVLSAAVSGDPKYNGLDPQDVLVTNADDDTTLADNLIGYWPFDGDGADLSPSDLDLTLYGGVGFATGLFGQALDLHNDGKKYAARPIDDAIYDFGPSDFTIQVWVNFNNTDREQTLFEKFQGQAGPGWTLTKLVDNRWHFYARPSAELSSAIQTIQSGVWHQVVARRKGNTFDIFYDGVLIVSGSDPDPVPDTTYPLLVGKRNKDDGRNFAVDGRIDEVAIWNRTLSDREIATLYNEGSGRRPLETAGITVSPTSGLITSEAGGTATFTVVLDSQPTAEVSIEVSSSDPSEGLVSTGGGTPAERLTLTFTPTNWATPQTVTVTGVDDSERDGDVAYTIITRPATSSDSNYNGLDAADVSVTNLDDEPPIGNPNDMYVWDIEFESRTRGKAHDERIRVTVRRDSDGDGAAEATDEAVAGASVTVVLTGPKSSTLSGTTDSTGVFTSGWVTKVPDGTYLAEVTALTHSTYVWNKDLDPTTNDTDVDGDNLPDQQHINPHSGGSSANFSSTSSGTVANNSAAAAALPQANSQPSQAELLEATLVDLGYGLLNQERQKKDEGPSVNFSSTSTATVDSNSAAATALRQPNSQPPQAELADAALVGLRFGSLNEEGQDHDQADLTEFLELDLGPGLLKDLALAPRRWYSLRGNGKLPAFESA